MENLSPENSLRLIAETIEKSRNSIAKNAGKPLIFWGALVSITAFVIWALWTKTGNPMWNLLWLAMTVVGIIGNIFFSRKNEKMPDTEITRIIGRIWMWFGVFSTGFFALTWIVALIRHLMGTTDILHISLTLIIALMLGLCGAISGSVMRMKSLTASCVAATFLSLLLVMLAPETSPLQILCFVIIGIFALIVPGVLLQKKVK